MVVGRQRGLVVMSTKWEESVVLTAGWDIPGTRVGCCHSAV